MDSTTTQPTLNFRPIRFISIECGAAIPILSSDGEREYNVFNHMTLAVPNVPEDYFPEFYDGQNPELAVELNWTYPYLRLQPRKEYIKTTLATRHTLQREEASELSVELLRNAVVLTIKTSHHWNAIEKLLVAMINAGALPKIREINVLTWLDQKFWTSKPIDRIPVFGWQRAIVDERIVPVNPINPDPEQQRLEGSYKFNPDTQLVANATYAENAAKDDYDGFFSEIANGIGRMGIRDMPEIEDLLGGLQIEES